MKPLCLLFLWAAAAFSQPFSFGVKGGMPMTDFVNTATSGRFTASTATSRYIVGPTAELRLPFGLGVEVDLLYRHFHYSSSGGIGSIASNLTNMDTTAGAWEFPLLAKYRFKGKHIRPFLDAGVAWDKLSGLTQTVQSVVASVSKSTTTSTPLELSKDVTRGYVMGGGVDVKVLLIHISPEVRFTRWGAKHFIDPNGLLNSKVNQAEFLVGITF
ncbi:MAG: outer membrane beta-barrel protein [Candidatus Solibacter sp.]|nr:outer membrane beta-barrel protein [Candidatus Solibacter sp.]